MVVILRTMFMRDLRGNWVFPRLAYAATGQAVDRNARRLFRFLVRRPVNRVREFFATLRDHESVVEILLAGFAVLTAFVRALAFLLLAIGSLYAAIFRF
jgi:hypothetical protein